MNGNEEKSVYKIVLTGGPCGGKTTGQSRLHIFFENIGWKVLRVPEAATLLLGGGISFGRLNRKQSVKFQENLLKSMLQLEKSFFDVVDTNPPDIKDSLDINNNNLTALVSNGNFIEDKIKNINRNSLNLASNPHPSVDQNTLIICDRGTMDPAAYMQEAEFHYILRKNGWSIPLLRDTRYDLVIHMVTAANGAESFYTCQGNQARHEGLEEARAVDKRTADVWVGHPHFDIIDNSTGFEAKILRLLSVVCRRLGVKTNESLKITSKKRKFLITNFDENNPDDLKALPPCQVFSVVHDYLISPEEFYDASPTNSRPSSFSNTIKTENTISIDKEEPGKDGPQKYGKSKSLVPLYKRMPQARLKKRGVLASPLSSNLANLTTLQYNVPSLFTYLYTVRLPEMEGQCIEQKRQIDAKEYHMLLQSQRDRLHATIYKTRRCFLYQNHYYRLDVYQSRCPKRCRGLVLLETYTTIPTDQLKLPPFLHIAREVTGDPAYSMWNLSLKDSTHFDSHVLMDTLADSNTTTPYSTPGTEQEIEKT